MRVVSLLPSATEVVYALGQGQSLVARSHECDFPVAVGPLPVVTSSKIELHGASYAIDQRVRAIAAEGVSIYRVDVEALDALAPDVLITQDQCDVCAVSLRDVEAAVCQLVRSQPRIVTLSPHSLDDVWRDIARVAQALDVAERGAALVATLKARMEQIGSTASTLPRPSPSVACVEWIAPLMAAGNWMPTLVELAGGRNLFGAAGEHSPWLTLDALAAADPDVILFLPCGFDLAHTQAEVAALRASRDWSRWAELRAVKGGRVYLTDGSQYFNRPGPRLVESLEILAELLHPERFSFGHRGGGFVQL